VYEKSTKVKKSFDGMVTVESDRYQEERFKFQKSFNAVSILVILLDG